MFSALSHRKRRAILVTLSANQGSMMSGAIAGYMDSTWQTTSRHLRLLEEAGLIEPSLRGRERISTLRADRTGGLLGSWLRRFAGADEPSGEPTGDGARPPGRSKAGP